MLNQNYINKRDNARKAAFDTCLFDMGYEMGVKNCIRGGTVTMVAANANETTRKQHEAYKTGYEIGLNIRVEGMAQ